MRTKSTSAADSDGRWVAVQVRAGCEKTVSFCLRERGYEEFLPFSRGFRHRAERSREFPLFPGYVFCRYVRVPRHRIVEIPGVVRVVGASQGPFEITEEEMLGIRRVVDSGLYSEPWKFIQIGQRVVVTNGPLDGLAGILVNTGKGARLVVALPLLGRGVAVEIAAADIIPMDVPKPPPGRCAAA